jgi:hypothetical protein
VLFLKINGTGSDSASCSSADGSYSIPSVNFAGDVVLSAYLKVSGTTGATVSKTPNGDITDFDLYEHYLIVRHEDVLPLSNEDLAVFDSGNDGDIPYSAATGSPDTLNVEPENGLYVWNNKIFTPDGTVTLESGGSGASYDGTIRLGPGSSLEAQGSEAYSVGGSWIAATSSTFVRAQSVVTFTATTSSKTIQPASNFSDVSFSGGGGSWSIASSTTVRGSLTVTAGTVSGTGDVTVYEGPVTGDGTIAMTDGTFSILH